jgi:hypothetical protein
MPTFGCRADMLPTCWRLSQPSLHCQCRDDDDDDMTVMLMLMQFCDGGSHHQIYGAVAAVNGGGGDGVNFAGGCGRCRRRQWQSLSMATARSDSGEGRLRRGQTWVRADSGESS